MLRRKLAQTIGWLSKTITHFLANPLQMIGAAGVVMGFLVVSIGVVLTVAMFSPLMAASALAATVAPLLRDLALTMLAIIGVVIMVMLGFKNFSAKFMGAEIEATMAQDALHSVQDALEQVSAKLEPEDPS